MKPGIYNNLDIDEYHNSEGISSTGISLLLDCPKRYHYEYHGKPEVLDPKEQQEARNKYKMGRALHMLVLEPEKFDATFYCMAEKVNLTTKIGKELWAKAELEANGREILRAGSWEDIKAMAESVKSHSIWKEFKDGLVEQSIYWEGGVFNTELKARPDIFNDRLIIDVKTTDSIKLFANSIYNYGYHRQAAMQIDGLKTVDGKKRLFAYFVVEKKAPYLTGCFTLDEVSLDQGRREYLDAAITYTECKHSDIWPDYQDQNDNKFRLISIPKWAIKSEEDK